MITGLIDIISREAQVFEAFLALLNQQKTMLVSNNIDGLNATTELQREKLVESQLLARERERFVEQIKIVNALDGDLTVSRLIELVDSEHAETLHQLKETIIALNQKIAKVRDSNAMLINQSREFISRTMTMLAQIGRSESAYDRAGCERDQKSTLLLDRTI
ncbi:MAG: flagellar protein FlgN [candidate division Zixibacteria bacterium]|nr:flagellar protein FlgN [candidate division Zixibacteria bacterium]